MKTIQEILRGVLIGLANIIPGVSGGTMMVSMGIYDTIIGCINTLFKDFKRCVKILWPYLAGMVLGVPVFAMIYSAVSRLAARSLKKRGLPTATKEYMTQTLPQPCGETKE